MSSVTGSLAGLVHVDELMDGIGVGMLVMEAPDLPEAKGCVLKIGHKCI